jgi:hypothetical protein
MTDERQTHAEAAMDSLRGYIAEHGGRLTDEAMTRALLEAGHEEGDIQTALAAYRAAETAGPVRSRAIRAITIAYVTVYVLLSAGMLANSRPPGYLMPDARGGIVILTVSLAIAYIGSMIWVASRRAFGILAVAVLALGSLTGGLAIAPIGVIGLIWLLRRRTAVGQDRETRFEVLLAIPIVLLLGVGGLCVASGLPLPGGA